MNIKKAIQIYKNNLNDSIYNMKEFTMIGCNSINDKFKCGCVQGVEWNDISVKNQKIYTKRYIFDLSIRLSNELESLWLPLIQPERLNQNWSQRNSKKKGFK